MKQLIPILMLLGCGTITELEDIDCSDPSTDMELVQCYGATEDEMMCPSDLDQNGNCPDAEEN